MAIADLTEQELNDLRAAIEMSYGEPVNRFRAVDIDQEDCLLVVFESDQEEGTEQVACTFGEKVAFTTLATLVNSPGDTDFRAYTRDQMGRFAKKAGHTAEHIAENVVAWKTGKVIGGAIAAVAAQHGVNPELAKLLSESAVQATTATALYARKGGRTGSDLARKFIAESAAALAGKISHTGVDEAVAALGGPERVQQISALFAGKGAGIGTNAAVSKFLESRGRRLKSILASGDSFSDYDFSAGAVGRLTDEDNDALFDLAIAGYFSALEPPDSSDFRSVVDRVIRWNGLAIGLEYAPGAVRFPGRYAHRMKSGYGHLRGMAGDDRKALDCYIHPRLLDSPEDAPTAIWAIDQIDPGTGEHDEFKWMLGYRSAREATDAYLAEMPSSEYFGGIRRVKREDLEAGLSFAEILTNTSLGTYDFAAKKSGKKNCTAGKSHFCQRPGGAGSCISIKRNCRYQPDGNGQQVANYVGQKMGDVAPVKKQAIDAGTVAPATGSDFKTIKKTFDLNDNMFPDQGSLMFSAQHISNVVAQETGGPNLEKIKMMTYSVSFKINDTYDAGSIGDPKEGVKAALKIRKEMQAVFKDLPDGTIVHNQPYAGDGKGKERAELYQRFGFGKPIRQPDPLGLLDEESEDQFGMVIGGKVYPLDQKGLLDVIDRAQKPAKEAQ